MQDVKLAVLEEIMTEISEIPQELNHLKKNGNWTLNLLMFVGSCYVPTWLLLVPEARGSLQCLTCVTELMLGLRIYNQLRAPAG